jgi:hypothetical protein
MLLHCLGLIVSLLCSSNAHALSVLFYLFDFINTSNVIWVIISQLTYICIYICDQLRVITVFWISIQMQHSSHNSCLSKYDNCQNDYVTKIISIFRYEIIIIIITFAVPTNIKIVKSCTRVVGPFMTLSALELWLDDCNLGSYRTTIR